MRRLLPTACCAALLLLSGRAGAQSSPPSAPPAPASPPAPAPASPRPAAAGGYVPPDTNRLLEGSDAEIRPLLRVLRSAGELLGPREWQRNSSVELGTSLIDKDLAPYYEKERLQKLSAGFKEGWLHIYVMVPEVISMQVVEMADADLAHDFYVLNLDLLHQQFTALNESEDARVMVNGEEDLKIPGLDEAKETRYEQAMADLPTPTRYRTYFGRTGRYLLNITYVQSETTAETARHVLEGLAARLRDPGAAGA
jgi:hypothetical protein